MEHTNGNRLTNNSVLSDDQFRLVQNELREFATNEMMNRQAFFNKFGDPRRDIDKECGYPSNTTFAADKYRELYDREPIGTRVVELFPKESWQVQPTVYEDDDPNNATEFEKAWDNLGQSLMGGRNWLRQDEGHPVWEYLKRVDILSGVGSFGVLLIGIDDGRALHEPVEGVVSCDPPKGNTKTAAMNRRMILNSARTPLERERAHSALGCSIPTRRIDAATLNQMAKTPQRHAVFNAISTAQEMIEKSNNPQASVMGTDEQYLGVQIGPTEYVSEEPSKKKRRLIYLRAFDESQVQITQYEANIRNPRFGQPVMYRITLNDARDMHSGIGQSTSTVNVHWSRVLHVADNLGSSEVFGVPRQRPVLNPVIDIRKIRAASAESFWQSCFPILSFETHPQFGGDVDVDQQRLQNTVENVMNSFQRWMQTSGLTVKSLPPQIVDPTPQINVMLEAICIQLGCPVRAFRGSERGELASSQDDSAWNDRLRERHHGYLTPRLIAPFINRMIMMGCLPEPCVSRSKKPKPKSMSPQAPADPITPPAPGAPPGGKPFGGGGGKPPFPPTNNADDMILKEDVDTTELDSPLPPKEDPADEQYEVEPGYYVEWPDLDSLGKKDKAAIALQEVQAITGWASGGGENVMTAKDFWTDIMGRTEEEADAILFNLECANEMNEQVKLEEQENVFAQHEDMIDRGLAPDPVVQQDIEMEAAKNGGKQLPPQDLHQSEFLPDEEEPTDNIFCATGPGGGVDATCSKDSAGSNSGGSSHEFTVKLTTPIEKPKLADDATPEQAIEHHSKIVKDIYDRSIDSIPREEIDAAKEEIAKLPLEQAVKIAQNLGTRHPGKTMKKVLQSIDDKITASYRSKQGNRV